ncbi:hypothetical protein [Sphingorhabdus sp. EL138]|uniref:hypothetical protein n=1 Tax=Sphingorhabdus sp. EL138 TaxID=2073156 RepID=UPI0025E80CE5|nr:hypothetical protein [Sphingorhabdus sp. EL138]
MNMYGILVSLSASAFAAPQPADQFFTQMSTLCSKSFNGKLAAGDDSDASFATAKMQAVVRTCTDREIQISFDVDEDRSRTWIITRTDSGLRLKHRHMLKDGTEDPVSQYGGDTAQVGTAMRQEFPVDAYSKAMFTKEGRTVSNTNVWAFEIDPGQTLTYELARPNRLFRVAFDVANPVTGASE